MNNNLPDDLKMPDFENLTAPIAELKARISELVSPMMNTLSHMEQILSPLLESMQSVKIDIDGISTVLLNTSRTMGTIRRLGEAQFVYWDFFSDEFIKSILDATNVDAELENLYISNNQEKIKKLLEKLENHVAMTRHRSLFQQTIHSAQNGDFALAIIGLISIFDGLLSDVTGNNSTKLAARSNVVFKKLENDETIDSDEFAILILMMTYEKSFGMFTAHSDFSQDEPEYLNRHWIMHGRSLRPKGSLDYLKILHLIYGFLLIKDIGDKDKENT